MRLKTVSLLSTALSASIAASFSGPAVAGCELTSQLARLSSAKSTVQSSATSLASPTAAWSGPESQAITGYWHIQTLDDLGNVLDQRFDNYFADHNELFVDTTPPVQGNTCNGTWIQTGRLEFKLLHLTWQFDSSNTIAIAYAAIRDVISLSKDEQSLSGTESFVLYDLNGNVQATFGPFVLKGKRVTVNF
jgi:hypothetical protein